MGDWIYFGGQRILIREKFSAGPDETPTIIKAIVAEPVHTIGIDTKIKVWKWNADKGRNVVVEVNPYFIVKENVTAEFFTDRGWSLVEW
jgi:hypothetical protein